LFRGEAQAGLTGVNVRAGTAAPSAALNGPRRGLGG